MSVYRATQLILRGLWPLVGRVDLQGLENVPREGPFLLIANHQSYLDPILVQSLLPRPLYTMAKSTEFSTPAIGRLLQVFKSFPVRRFEIDPQAVRTVLRHLEAGRGVGIYIEGERTWDGRLLPPRLGTIRLILKAGVPVLPCGVSGAYEVWPRWGRLRRGTLRVRLGPPMRFPKLDSRPEREAALDEARERIMGTLADLAGVGRADQSVKP